MRNQLDHSVSNRCSQMNRSHREGPLGSVFNQDPDSLAGGGAGYRAAGNLLEQYPLALDVLGMSAPEQTHYQLGDCTVHHPYCAHGSINNTTDRDRVGYLWSYSCADTRYLDGAGSADHGSSRKRAEDELAHPVIFRPPPPLVGVARAVSLAKL